MDEQTEAVWRKALQARGKDWVMSELHRRPGLPEDALYDVVFKEPYPSRATIVAELMGEDTLVEIVTHTHLGPA